MEGYVDDTKKEVQSRDDGSAGAIYRRSRIITGGRPAFMEPLPPGFPRYYNAPRGNIFTTTGALHMRRKSSFPIKDDAGYIGYLSDRESNNSDEGNVMNMQVLHRRRQELLGSDMSFSSCLMLFVTVCGLLLLFLFAASPWGIPPPRRL
jgi:hypothetical protein